MLTVYLRLQKKSGVQSLFDAKARPLPKSCSSLQKAYA